MFHIYFLGSSEGLIFDVANANFDVALWNPLRGYLESRGARFHTGVSVTAVTTDPQPARALRLRRRLRLRRGGAGHRCGGPCPHRRRLTRAG